MDFSVDDVELTLTPEGPLVDRSAGQIIVVQPVGNEVNDVPIGRYTISSRYVTTSGAERNVPLANRNGDESLLPTQLATFVNDSYYGLNIELYVQVQ